MPQTQQLLKQLRSYYCEIQPRGKNKSGLGEFNRCRKGFPGKSGGVYPEAAYPLYQLAHRTN